MSLRPHTSKEAIPLPLVVAGVLLSLSVSGCQLLEFFGDGSVSPAKSRVVASPPSIPEPPQPKAPKKDESGLNPMQAPNMAFKDIELMDVDSVHKKVLKEALAYALDQGVLSAGKTPRDFEPDVPVNWDTICEWIDGFKEAYETDVKARQAAQAKPTEDKDKKKAPQQPVMLGSQAAVAPGLTKYEIMRYLQTISREAESGAGPTREKLTTLIGWLRPDLRAQFPIGQAMTKARIPNDPVITHRLSETPDYEIMSPWARPSIAWAYQNTILFRVFDLSATALTVDQGFSPHKEVTRAEAITFLYLILIREQRNMPPTGAPTSAP